MKASTNKCPGISGRRKKREREGDPEMHQFCKCNQWNHRSARKALPKA
jgi:hypothetical protein